MATYLGLGATGVRWGASQRLTKQRKEIFRKVCGVVKTWATSINRLWVRIPPAAFARENRCSSMAEQRYAWVAVSRHKSNRCGEGSRYLVTRTCAMQRTFIGALSRLTALHAGMVRRRVTSSVKRCGAVRPAALLDFPPGANFPSRVHEYRESLNGAFWHFLD
jgi:hypothetical protein